MSQRGFTLLEVMVAFTLIVFIAFGTIMAQSQASSGSVRNRNLIIATQLARNLINQEELKREGRPLENVEEKQTGAFESNKDFKYTIEYSKVDFSALTDLIARETNKQAEKNEGQDANQMQMVMKIFKDYMEKSVRRMRVTIEWPEGKGSSQQTFSELLVDYDQELNAGF